MNLAKLLENEDFVCQDDLSVLEINKVTSRVNEITKNTLFVLVKGINFDTGKIIEYVLLKHPKAIICDFDREIKTKIPLIRVKDARRTLAILSSKINNIDYRKLRIVGITGTNGKTTTATILYRIFCKSGIKTEFIGTGKILIGNRTINKKNYSMTTPDPEILYPTLHRMQEEGCEVVIMEISSHAIALGKIAPIRFEYGIFTNLSEEHLDFHKDLEEYFNTKLSLFNQCENGIFNADDEYSLAAIKRISKNCRAHSVGMIWDADAMARDVILNGFEGSTYIYREHSLIFKVNLILPGTYNIYNSLMATKCAVEMKIDPLVIKTAVSEIKSIDGRLEILNDDICVIVDYAHTERAYEKLLNTVNSFKKPEQKVITVFGCGGDRDKNKRPKIAAITEKYSDFVIVTSDNPRTERECDIISDILVGFKDAAKRKVISSRERAIRYAILSAPDNSIVVVVGKGHERYNINADGYHDFDEKKIICDALSARKKKV